MVLETLQLAFSDAFWSAVAALGFATLFNVPPRLIWACALTGAVGHACRTVLVQTNEVDIVLGTLIASTTMGFMSVGLGKWLHAPPPIFAVSGSIPMVPGVFAYSTMLGILALTDDSATLETLLDTTRYAALTGVILAAIAGGISLPQLLFRREKPVV
jgi:uncharacterized membrane protein YjjB (DUF3815 family)